MVIKVLNWNVYNRNKNYINIIELIKNSNADVICLQETSEELLNRLKDMHSYSISTALDFYEFGNPSYLVTLVRSGFNPHSDIIQLKINTNISKQGKKYDWVEGIEALFTDIIINQITLRIYNIHISAGCSPEIRKKEIFKCLQTIDPNMINVLCGDFNTPASPLINPFFGHLFNFSLRDYFVNEKKTFKKVYNKYNLKSIFKNEITEKVEIISFPIIVHFPLISDYILVSKSVQVLGKQIYTNTFGSDHRALETEIVMAE